MVRQSSVDRRSVTSGYTSEREIKKRYWSDKVERAREQPSFLPSKLELVEISCWLSIPEAVH